MPSSSGFVAVVGSGIEHAFPAFSCFAPASAGVTAVAAASCVAGPGSIAPVLFF